MIFASILGPEFCNTLTKIHMYPSIINQSIIHLTSILDEPSLKKMNKYINKSFAAKKKGNWVPQNLLFLFIYLPIHLAPHSYTLGP